MPLFNRNRAPASEAARGPLPHVGVPGIRVPDTVPPAAMAALLARRSGQTRIGKEEICKAAEILRRYKEGKTNLEERIVQDELFWKLQHWESVQGKSKKQADTARPTSAWLFNAIINKHADAMDNFPEPVVLPREQSDEDSAKTLSSVLPVIMEYNDFEQTYSNAWNSKLKHGTCAYGVFWDPAKDNGLGDIEIREIDLLKLFWEPGITDIQQSRNLFIAEMVDDDVLQEQYPQLQGKSMGMTVDIKSYLYDDSVDTSKKSVVVDWYYKVKSPDGRTLLHYAKFVGDELLYASENDPACQAEGFYDDGEYPVELDVLFPEEGTPVGFGYVAICKDPQLYIDRLSGSILENAMITTRKRYFCSTSTNVNREQFLDVNNPLVDVEGEISDTRLKEITGNPVDAIYLNVLQMKIEEMKDTAANRDVNSGGTGSGVTAAAAIAALQEAGNKVSRDMIAASYRVYTKISQKVLNRARQFYDEARAFRVTAPNGAYEFITMSNAILKDQPMGPDSAGEMLFRRPIFDLKVKAHKTNPFSRMEQNETAKELYRLGFFNPENAQASLTCLEMMEFEGVDKMKEKVQEGQTLFNMVQQLMAQNQMLMAQLGILPQPAPEGSSGRPPAQSGGQTVSSAAKRARQGAMTDYGQALAQRSRPSVG